MAIETHKERHAKEAARRAAKALQSYVAGCQDVLLLFSGGSPIEILKHLSPEGFDSRVTVGVSDERFSPDSRINNFAQLAATPWYQTVAQQGISAIDTRVKSEETVTDAGRRLDAALKAWKQKHPQGTIAITQGIGLDGHTAGMMPYPEDEHAFGALFAHTDAWAVGYDAGGKNKYPLRVTTTIPFLTMVDLSVLYVCGEDKRAPLSRVLASEGSVYETPGRIVHQMKHCLLFTDLSL